MYTAKYYEGYSKGVAAAKTGKVYYTASQSRNKAFHEKETSDFLNGYDLGFMNGSKESPE